ncbi:DUF2953 domain-containing protein [Pelotomaculum propionicicum]|uniref:DUF2953 domain-containing protein n=1 Tax=Pelotomaculum propionicicum TaxID=258475 RepID=UPI003B7C7BA6
MGRAFLPVILASIFLLVIFLTKITLRLSYRKQGKDDHFAFGFSLWRGLIHYKLEIPVIKMQDYDKEPKKERQWLKPLLWPRPAFKIKAEIEGKSGRLLSEEKKKVRIPGPAKLLNILYNAILKVKKYYPVILYLIRHIKVRRFHWRTEIGVGEPSQTGILAGTAWGLKGFVLSWVYHMLAAGVSNPVINVTPNFKKACFNTNLDCIFEIRIGYIIFTSFKALVIRLK